MADDITRRGAIGRALTWAAGVPLIVAGGTALSPLIRVLRPTVEPFEFNKGVDEPPAIKSVAANLSDPEIAYVWGSKSFVFGQMNVEYTPNHLNASTIPGFVVKIPPEIATKYAQYFRTGPVASDKDSAATAAGIEKGQIAVFSRICVHLGCVFNYFGPKPKPGAPPASLKAGPGPTTDAFWTPYNQVVKANYNYPGALPDQGYFSCPCHFSVYDLNQFDPAHDNKLGKVVSGPAPRPPRFIHFEIMPNGDIVAKGVESGGVA